MARRMYEIKNIVNENGQVQIVPINRKTKERYVEQANELWNGLYDYTDSIYEDNKKPITIYCPKHKHHFTVPMAQNHILKPKGTFRPTGCPICSAEKLHGIEYDENWQEHLELCQNNKNRVRKKVYEQKKKQRILTEEEIMQGQAQQKVNTQDKAKHEFLSKLHARYGNRYGTQLVVYQGRETPITLLCPEHGPFKISPRTLLNGQKGRSPHGCWECEGIKRPEPSMNTEVFVGRMRELYPDTELDFSESKFCGREKPVSVRCAKHGLQTHSANWWLKGKGCEYCNGKFFPNDFLQLAREKHGNKYQYRNIEQITNKNSIILIHCDNPTHGWHEQRVDRHLAGDGCRECAGRHQPRELRAKKFLDEAIEKFGTERFDYSRVLDEYVNNDTHIHIRCNEHKYWFPVTPDSHIRKNGGCPICNLSRGEMEILLWLEKHQIKYTRQEPISHNNLFCRSGYLKPDFFVPKHSLVIEFHGLQHYEDVPFFRRDKNWSLEDQQERDQTLRDECIKRKWKILEIKYDQIDEIDKILSRWIKTDIL